MATSVRSDAFVFGAHVHLAGTGYLVNNASGYAAGVSTIAIDTGTLSISKGQTFRIAPTGSPPTGTVYTVTKINAGTTVETDDGGKGFHAVGATEISFTPALSGSVANNDPVVFVTTRQPLPPYQLTDSLVILADTDNAGAVYIGGSNVASTFGFELRAGSAIEVKCADASSVYITGTANDHVYITGS